MPALPFRTVCPHDCPDTCAMLATVEDGRLTRVWGDPDDPFTRGFLCAKVNRYPERVHSPDRLLQPLRRSGPKGSGSWQPVSWEEALDETVARWQEIQARWGSEALVGYAYSGHMGQVSRGLPQALFHALGASQILTGTVCDTSAEAGWAAAYGDCSPLDPEAAARADLIVAWGSDVATTNVHLWPFIEDARRQGARLVAIAPYRNRTARGADRFLPIRIGTDTALALGVAHVLFRDRLADLEYLRQDADGWEAWAEGTVARCTPRWTEAETGIPAAQVERLAHDLAAARAPFIRIGPSIGRNRNGARAVQAVALLAAVLGAWKRPGAGAFLETAYAFPLEYAAIRRPDLLPRPTRVLNQVQLGAALTELQNPPVMALMVMGNNPAVTCPDAGRVRQGLQREDLFTVVHESFMTETAELADLVLPATTSVESEDFFRSYGHLYLRYARPILPPQGEARPNAWVAQQLALRLGFADPVFTRSVADHLRAAAGQEAAEALLQGERVKVSPTGGLGRWATPSGRVDFTWAPAYEPDLPAGQEPPYPLRLLSTPEAFQSHTSFEAVETLRRRAGPTRVLLHPQEAAARGLRSGDAVELFNQGGRAGLELEVTYDVPPGLAVVPGPRSARLFLSGGPVNVLTSDELTDMGEGATYQSTWVDVRPLELPRTEPGLPGLKSGIEGPRNPRRKDRMEVSRMVNGEELGRLLNLTADRLRDSLEGFSEEQLTARPHGLAPALWQVGHVAVSEAGLLGRAGRSTTLPEGYEALFAMGSSGDGPFPEPEQVLAFFDDVDRRMVELAGGDLNHPAPSPRGTYRTAGEGLAFMLYHRGYHHGKIMTLRSLLGKRRLLG